MKFAKHIFLVFLSFSCVAVRAQIINTIAGNGLFGLSGDGGQATSAQIYGTAGMAVDDSGNLYIADLVNNRVRKVNPAGIITTFAGSGTTPVTGSFGGDGGAATAAQLYWPAAIAIDHHGNLLIADAINNRIRKVDGAGIISTIAGSDSAGFSGDGGPASAARLRYSYGVAVDRYDNIFIADGFNNRIRRVDTNGIITTVAGNGDYASIDSGGYSGDGGPATAAALYWPQSVTVDTSGNIFIADMMNNRIRKVGADGVISTFAGSGILGYSGDYGPAVLAQMINPSGVALDGLGNLYIADGGNNRVRMVSPSGIITTRAGTGVGGFSGDGDVDTAAQLFSPSAVTLDKDGNIYISDASNYRIRKISVPVIAGITLRYLSADLRVYPNPASSSFTINVASRYNSNVRVSITDASGRTVKDLLVPANKDVLVGLNVPAGMYTINAFTRGGIMTSTLVVTY